MAAGDDQKINIRALTSASVAAIGLIAAKALQSGGVVTLQVGDSGFVELVPAGELELDRLPEQEALQELIARDYADSQLADYLRQRAHREAWKQFEARNNEMMRFQAEMRRQLMAQEAGNEAVPALQGDKDGQSG